MRSASKVVLFAIASATAGVSVAFIGCMGEGTLLPPLAAPSDAQADADASTTLAWLRLANLSPTAPNIDFCAAPVTPVGPGTFQGPLLAQLVKQLTTAGATIAANMGGSGLTFTQASAYVPVASLQPYVIRIVSGNAGSCTAGILPDLTTLPTPPPDAGFADNSPLQTNEFMTIALLGEQLPTNTLQAVALVDDPAADGGISASKAYLRFFHAGLGQPPVDVIYRTTNLLFSGVAYGQVSAPPSPNNPEAGVLVDNNGYWATSPLSGQIDVFDAGEEGGAGHVTSAMSLSVAGGALVTLALVGDSVLNDAGIGTAPYQLLMCVDNGATAGVLANCLIQQ